MNCQQFLKMGSLVLALAQPVVDIAFSIKPAYSHNTSVKQPTNFNLPPSSATIAQLTEASSPIYGTWRLQFSLEGVIYNSVLTMQGYSGSMRTWFFNTRIGRTVAVDQTMILKSSAYGLVLLGSNPVYADTIIPATYNPDNFLFQVRTDGVLVAVTCDAIIPDRCSPVDIEFVR